MHWLSIQRLLGLLLMLFSATLLPPILIALLYQDGQLAVFLEGMIALLIVGSLLWVPARHFRDELRVRDGFLFVTLFYFSIPYFLISFGEQYVSSGLTALIFSSMPVFMLIFSSLILKEKLQITQALGIGIGFFSLLMILSGAGVSFTYERIIGAAAIFSAAIMHGLTYVVTKKVGSDISVITYNTLPIGLAGMLMLIAGLFLEDVDPNAVSATSVWALVYLGLVASVGGFIVYFYLLKRLSSIVVSFVFIIFPVFAVAVDALINNKPISAAFAAKIRITTLKP